MLQISLFVLNPLFVENINIKRFLVAGLVLHYPESLIDRKLPPILFVSDINECEEVAGICTNGDCQNLDGSLSCICGSGLCLTPSRDSYRYKTTPYPLCFRY